MPKQKNPAAQQSRDVPPAGVELPRLRRRRDEPDVDQDDRDDGSWDPVDLGPAIRGDKAVPEPNLLTMSSGEGLFYRGRVNGIHGDSGTGKSMICCYAATQVLEAGGSVLWIDYEDVNEASLVERLQMMGAEDETIEAQLVYLAPQAPARSKALLTLSWLVEDHAFDLMVVDSVGEAFGVEGIDEDRDRPVAEWMRQVPRFLAESGAAVVVVDHSTKSKDNALFPSGSKRKRAAISGASYFAHANLPMTRELGGLVSLKCAKDRHGHYQRGKDIAQFRLEIGFIGMVAVSLDPATTSDADPRILAVIPKIVEFVKGYGKPASKNVIEAGVKAKAAAGLKRAALDAAVDLECLRRTKGARGALLHEYIRDFDPETDGAAFTGQAAEATSTDLDSDEVKHHHFDFVSSSAPIGRRGRRGGWHQPTTQCPDEVEHLPPYDGRRLRHPICPRSPPLPRGSAGSGATNHLQRRINEISLRGQSHYRLSSRSGPEVGWRVSTVPWSEHLQATWPTPVGSLDTASLSALLGSPTYWNNQPSATQSRHSWPNAPARNSPHRSLGSPRPNRKTAVDQTWKDATTACRS